MGKLILISNGNQARLDNLPPDTQDYFKKLSGYDTLRLILAKKAILVEGPSDELVVQKAYLKKHDKLPIEDGVDVINVRGLSFKRFLDIAKELGIAVSVVTDNDGDYATKITKKYQDYATLANIHVYADSDNTAPTLEPQIVKCNDLATLNNILGTSVTDKDALSAYMIENKTECALLLFETEQEFISPQYIQDAVS